jgi:transposase InsO family protein
MLEREGISVNHKRLHRLYRQEGLVLRRKRGSGVRLPCGRHSSRQGVQAELAHHLGYPKHAPKGNNSGNSRNGKSKKTLKGDFGSLPIEVPRDRNSIFEPQIVPKG